MQSTRPGFLETRPDQGPGQRFNPLDVAAGEVKRVDFALPRGAVISGRVTDDTGEPLPGVNVTALRFHYTSNGMRLFPGNAMPFSGRTDDRGDFRLPGLSPGTYVIAAELWTNAPGESYALTYYPGTQHLSEARRFNIGLSEQVTANIMMLLTRQVRVTGQVRSSSGEAFPNYRVTLRTESAIGGRGGQFLDRSGTFEILGVPPGTYTLDVFPERFDPRETRPREFASLPLVVGDEDMTGLLVTTGPGVTVSGRVRYDGTVPKSGTSQSWQPRVYASVVGNNVGSRTLSWYPDNGVIAEDGSFTIRGGNSRMLFRPTMIRGWELKSVMLDGVDITDVPYDTARGGTDRLEIVVTDQRQHVSGRVVDTLGRPASRFVVITFPSDLKEGAVPGRFFALSSTTRSDGTFQLQNLPPGRYFAAAFTSVHDDAQFDVDFHAPIKDRATPFDLSPGETVTLELPLLE